MPGTLYVVATPIGNLEDLTFRALRTLKEVDLVAAEDTRRTRKLLSHYGLSKPLVSLHEHNEHRESPRLVERLVRGESIALVSDAGTPAISDPGSSLVRLARHAGISVLPIPGPSAITAALSVSGFAPDGFVFMGFPPTAGQARADWLDELADQKRPVVFFEAPHRITRTLRDVIALAKRQIFTCREISKKFEEYVIWPIDSTVSSAKAVSATEIGEYVVVVEGFDRNKSDSAKDSKRISDAIDMFGVLTNTAGLGQSDAIVAAAAVYSIKASKLNRALKKAAYAALAATRPDA